MDRQTPRAVQGGRCQEGFGSILVEMLGTEWLLQGQLYLLVPKQKGNISSPHAAQSAAEFVSNVFGKMSSGVGTG